MGYLLKRQEQKFLILEASTIASAWRGRWDSLTLFTSRRYSSLPGLTFPGDPDGYPTRDEVIAYLTEYAAHFDLPIEEHSPVRSLEADGARFRLDVAGKTILASQVVVATGAFRGAIRPGVWRKASSDGRVPTTHATGYRRASDIPASRTALVVGGGNTGFQIAKELSATHRVALAIGTRQKPLPQRLLGRDLFWWLSASGFFARASTPASASGCAVVTRSSAQARASSAAASA